MEALEVAPIYFDRGWHPLELPPHAKAPPPEGRTGYNGINMTRDEVLAAPWHGNIGVRMSSDCIGLDIDVYHGGDKTLAALVERLGPLPKTYISHNGRNDGSGIRIFRVPVKMHWVASMPGIEVIQEGHRFAVVWPSIHPDLRQYGWWSQMDDAPFDGVPLVEDLPDLPWPWINELSRPLQADIGAPVIAITIEAGSIFLESHPSGDQPEYVSVITVHFLDKVKAGHSRHDSMQHCLTWAMECVAANVLPSIPSLRKLGEAWQMVHTDPRRAELMSQSARVTEFDAMMRHAIAKAMAKTPAFLDELHDNIVGPTIGIATLAPAVVDDGFVLDWAMVRKGDAGEREWLVDGFWPAHRAMALWAKAKTGKSELMLWIAANLAIGRCPFTGKQQAPIKLLYLDYEMTEEDVTQRLDEFALLDHPYLDNLLYAIHPALPFLDTQEGGGELMRRVEMYAAKAVVIDTFGRVVRGDEDKADTVRAFYHHTGMRLKAAGVPYSRLDHGGKDETRGQRGSSAKYDDVDIIWRLSKTQAGATLNCAGSSRVSWVDTNIVLDRHERADAITYRRPSTVTMIDAATSTKIKELDDANIPADWGFVRVKAELKARGLTIGRATVLAAAIKVRRERKPAPGVGAGDE